MYEEVSTQANNNGKLNFLLRLNNQPNPSNFKFEHYYNLCVLSIPLNVPSFLNHPFRLIIFLSVVIYF